MPKRTICKPYYNPFDAEKGYHFKYKSNKISSYFDIKLPDVFSVSDCGRFYKLSKHLYPGSNLIGKRVGGHVRAFMLDDILKIVGLKDRQMKTFMQRAIEHNVIRRVDYRKDGIPYYEYYMNPVYFNACRYISLNLFILFQDSFQKHLPKEIIEKFLDQQEKLHANETANITN